MLSTFFKVYIRAKLPFEFFGVSFRMNGVKERRGFVKEMGERGVLAEKGGIKYHPRFFFLSAQQRFSQRTSA